MSPSVGMVTSPDGKKEFGRDRAAEKKAEEDKEKAKKLAALEEEKN